MSENILKLVTGRDIEISDPERVAIWVIAVRKYSQWELTHEAPEDIVQELGHDKKWAKLALAEVLQGMYLHKLQNARAFLDFQSNPALALVRPEHIFPDPKINQYEFVRSARAADLKNPI